MGPDWPVTVRVLSGNQPQHAPTRPKVREAEGTYCYGVGPKTLGGVAPGSDLLSRMAGVRVPQARQHPNVYNCLADVVWRGPRALDRPLLQAPPRFWRRTGSRTSSSRRSSGSHGTTAAACSNRSATLRQPSSRRATMTVRPLQSAWRFSRNELSGKPGAVQIVTGPLLGEVQFPFSSRLSRAFRRDGLEQVRSSRRVGDADPYRHASVSRSRLGTATRRRAAHR